MQDLEQAVSQAVENLPPPNEEPGATPEEQQHQAPPEHQEQEPPQPSEAETRARQQGWVPKEEFRGDASQWRSAEEFLEVGEKNANIARERNRALEAKLARQEQEWQDRFDRLEKTNQIALQRERERIAASYEAQKRDAAELGDLDKYDQLGRDQNEALKSYDESLREAQPEPQQQPNGAGTSPQLPPEIADKLTSWVDANPWMKRDKAMAGAASGYFDQLEAERPGLTIDEQLAETAAFVRRTFPDKFARPSQPAQPSAVEGGGGRQTNASAAQMTAANLPAEARKAAEQFIADGLFKDMNEYAKAYFAEDNV